MGKIFFQSRLSTGDANPIDPPLKGAEPTEHFFQGNRSVFLRMEDKGMIMAVRTAEVATGEEEDGTKFPWPIQKGRF